MHVAAVPDAQRPQSIPGVVEGLRVLPAVVAADNVRDVLQFAAKAKNLSGITIGKNLFLALGARPSPWELSGEQRVERLGDALAETRLRKLHAEMIHEIAKRWNNASEVNSTGALALTVRG